MGSLEAQSFGASTSTAPSELAERDRQLPVETQAQRRTVQVIAVLALAASVAYLIWRLGWTLGAWWISVPLWCLEAHAVFGLGLFTFSLWDLRPTPMPAVPDVGGHLRVAVLITTYDEPEEVLLPTIAGAVALPEVHQTLVLDDGDRPWLATLAERLGARYVARPDHSHAKAGNLNHAIDLIGDEVDVVAVLDADHVPSASFLTNTIGFFNDPGVALVQTPQDFYNTGSFEHTANRSLAWRTRRPLLYNEQALFYRGLQPGKNRWNASFWCGTNALVRVDALRQAGGVATDSLTEDIHTTLRLHRLGWRTVYHNEVLVFGLAARNIHEYRAQRLRWGTGAMQVLRREHPITAPGLTVPQRLSYATTLLGWFDAWRTLGYLVIPLVVLVTGQLPIRTDFLTFAVFFLATFLVQRIAMSVLAHGLAPQGVAAVFEMIRMPVSLRATLGIFSTRERRFVVTQKGQTKRGRPKLSRLLIGLSISSLVSLGWFAATLAGWTRLDYEQPGAQITTAAFVVANLVVIVLAIGRTRSDRFAGDRRRGERFRTSTRASLAGAPALLVDVSLSGALITTRHPTPLVGAADLTLDLDGGPLGLSVVERSRREVSPVGTYLVGLEFEEGQPVELAALSGRLFGTDARRPSRVASAA